MGQQYYRGKRFGKVTITGGTRLLPKPQHPGDETPEAHGFIPESLRLPGVDAGGVVLFAGGVGERGCLDTYT